MENKNVELEKIKQKIINELNCPLKEGLLIRKVLLPLVYYLVMAGLIGLILTIII